MAGTMRDKGTDYVAAWPANIAHKYGLSVSYVIEAINTVTGSTLTARDAYSRQALDAVSNLNPDTAREVVAEVKRVSDSLNAHAKTHCHYCGLPLQNSRCTECDA